MKESKIHPFNIGEHNAETKQYEKGLSAQGFVYKDYGAFNSRSATVCYIPEMCDTYYNYFDFLKIANGKKDIAVYLFETVDWQSPETLYEELKGNGEVQ